MHRAVKYIIFTFYLRSDMWIDIILPLVMAAGFWVGYKFGILNVLLRIIVWTLLVYISFKLFVYFLKLITNISPATPVIFFWLGLALFIFIDFWLIRRLNPILSGWEVTDAPPPKKTKTSISKTRKRKPPAKKIEGKLVVRILGGFVVLGAFVFTMVMLVSFSIDSNVISQATTKSSYSWSFLSKIPHKAAEKIQLFSAFKDSVVNDLVYCFNQLKR